MKDPFDIVKEACDKIPLHGTKVENAAKYLLINIMYHLLYTDKNKNEFCFNGCLMLLQAIESERMK
jgi:hypothetical protein